MIRDEVQSLGGEIVGEAYLSAHGANAAEIVREIARLEPDLIVNCVGGELSIAYSRALRAAGILPSQIPTMYFSVGELELLGLSSSESVGDYGAWSYFQSIEAPQNQYFWNSTPNVAKLLLDGGTYQVVLTKVDEEETKEPAGG